MCTASAQHWLSAAAALYDQIRELAHDAKLAYASILLALTPPSKAYLQTPYRRLQVAVMRDA